MRGAWLPIALLFGVVLPSCAADDDRVIEVFAASSLSEAFAEMGAAFEREHPEVEVRFNFAASSTLGEQLRDGAVADVFASANMAIMEELTSEGEVAGPAQGFARNRLVLAVPSANPEGVDSLDDLEQARLLIGACSPGVPCGDLALELFALTDLQPSLDTMAPNVRSLARWVADGELDAALVYASDLVAARDGLAEVPVDHRLPATTYPIAIVNPPDDVARQFVDFVLGAHGSAILERWGFENL